MIYIIDKIRDYIEKGQYDDAINLLDLYRMTIEAIGAVNYPYFRLISPNFEDHLYRQFKKWNNKQRRNKMNNAQLISKKLDEWNLPSIDEVVCEICELPYDPYNNYSTIKESGSYICNDCWDEEEAS